MANELRKRTEGTYIGTVDASGPAYATVFIAPCRCVIVGADIVCSATKAIGSANYGDYNIQNKGTTGSGTTEVASLSTKTGEADVNALAADKAEAMTLSTTVASLEVDEGESLQFAATEAGTATSGDLAEAYVAIHYVPGTGVGN